MKHLIVAMLIAASGSCAAQRLLEFRKDLLAFDAVTVETVAERAYRSRLRMLAADGRLDVNAVLLDRLRTIIDRLQQSARFEQPEASFIPWEIHTCRRCDENASAMAGGRLLVGEEFTDELVLSDDELGYVLAHEMAHVLAEHTREFATTARFFVGNGINRKYSDIQNELDESFVVNLRMAPVYAQQELEADYIGFILGARSGYDPEAMLSMLRKLQRGADSASPLLGLHPTQGERVRRAQAMLQSARRIGEIGFPDQ